jgi:hypothetical protein
VTTVSTTDVTLLLCLSLNQAHAESCCPIPSERNHRSPTCQKREENKFGEYVCVRTRQSGDRTS